MLRGEGEEIFSRQGELTHDDERIDLVIYNIRGKIETGKIRQVCLVRKTPGAAVSIKDHSDED